MIVPANKPVLLATQQGNMKVTRYAQYTEYRIFDEFGFTIAVFVDVKIADKVDMFTYLNDTDSFMRYAGNIHY